MITLQSAPDNTVLLYKCFLEKHGVITVFNLVQSDVVTVLDVTPVIEYPNSIEFIIRTDLSGYYGNDYRLELVNDTTVICEDKITILDANK
jgi:hypothetical protein